MVEILTKWSYIEPLLYKEEFIHLEEISRKLNKNHSIVRKYLNQFEAQGILTKKVKGRLTVYRLNLSHPIAIDYLAIAEKEKLICKCKKDLIINEIVSFLHSNLAENNKALIFGSAVINSKKANDIDLLITGRIGFELKLFEKKFNIKIHLIQVKDLKSVNESLRKEIIEKHLIVQGLEEIIKWLI